MPVLTRLAPLAVVSLGLAVALAPARPDAKPPGARTDAAIPPKGVAGFASLNVAAAWDHKAFEAVREARGRAEFAWVVQALVGVAPADLDRVTAFWPAADPGVAYLLVTGRQPLDPAAVVKTLTRAGGVKSKPVAGAKVLAAPGADFPHVLPLDAKTLLLAPPSADATKLETLAKQLDLPTLLTKAAGKHTLAVGVDVKALAGFPLPLGGPLLEADTAEFTADLPAPGVAGTAVLRLAFSRPEQAQAAAPLLRAKLDDLRGWAVAQEKRAADRTPERGAGYPAPLLEWVASTLKTAKVRADGPATVATAGLKLEEGLSALLTAVPDAALAPRGASAAENNLKQIMLAIHSYHDANGHAPTNTYDKDGKPLLSWRVLILPYIEQNAVYNQFKLDEAWDSETNKPLSRTVMRVFQVPGRPAAQPGETYFRSFVGPKGVKPDHRPWLLAGERRGPRLTAITDGTSNTVAVVEAAEGVPWSKPDDLPYDGVLPLPKLGGPGGAFAVAFGDGSVRSFRRGQLDEKTLRGLITVAGGEVLSIPER